MLLAIVLCGGKPRNLLGRRSEVVTAHIREKRIPLTKWKSGVGDVKNKETPHVMRFLNRKRIGESFVWRHKVEQLVCVQILSGKIDKNVTKPV